MKSLELLRNVYSEIEFAINETEVTEKDLKRWMDNINMFIIDNESKPKDAINLYDYIANDKLRPVMNGVYYSEEHKEAVSSDTKIVVASKVHYDESKAGKIIDKYGKEIEGKYPRYNTVFKNEEDLGDSFTIDVNDVIKARNAFKSIIKLKKFKEKDALMLYKIGNGYFKIEYIIHLLKFGDSFRVSLDNTSAYVYNENYRAMVLAVNTCDKIQVEGTAFLMYSGEVVEHIK